MLDEIGALALELGVLLRVYVQDHVSCHGPGHLPNILELSDTQSL